MMFTRRVSSQASSNDQPVAAASTSINFRCPEQFGYYADEYNCSKYFVCVFGEALHESCTGGLRFSSELQTCDWPRNVVCPLEDNDSSYDDDEEDKPSGGNHLKKSSSSFSKSSDSGSGIVLESTTILPLPPADNSFSYGFIQEIGGKSQHHLAISPTTPTPVPSTPSSDEAILQQSFDRLVKSGGRGRGKQTSKTIYFGKDEARSAVPDGYLDPLSNLAADLGHNRLEESNSSLSGLSDLNAVDDELDENFTIVDLQRQRVNIVRNGRIQPSNSYDKNGVNTVGRSIGSGSSNAVRSPPSIAKSVSSPETVLPDLDFVFKDVRHYTSQAAKNKAIASSSGGRITLDKMLDTFGGGGHLKKPNEVNPKRQHQQQSSIDGSQFDDTITALLNDRTVVSGGGNDEDNSDALLRIIAPLNNRHSKSTPNGPSLTAIDKALETLNFNNLTSSLAAGQVIVFNRTQVLKRGEGDQNSQSSTGNATSTLILIDHTTADNAGGGGGENRKTVLSSDYANPNELSGSNRVLPQDPTRQPIIIRTDKADDSSLNSKPTPITGRARANRTSKFSSKFMHTPPKQVSSGTGNNEEDIDILVNLQSNGRNSERGDGDFKRLRNGSPISTGSGRRRGNATAKAKETFISQPELRQSQYFTESPVVLNKSGKNSTIRHLGSHQRNSTRSSSSSGMSLSRNTTLQTPSRPAPLYETPQPFTNAVKCNPEFCRLPDCICSGSSIPGGLSAKDVPQLVLLSFDDAVNDANWNIYEEILNSGRSNPNGCPIKGTFYISHEWSDYSLVQTLYARGHEMASHSITHSFGERFTKQEWAAEHVGQREILHLYGGVNRADIRGMRAPFLQGGGNRQFEMLHETNFTYDSSMPVFENSPPLWPYTLDYAINHECMIAPCPTKSFPGLWEIGLVMWQDLSGGRCSMGDACSNPSDEQGVYELIMKNFKRHYESNRAPFGLFYHSAWFNNEHHRRGFLRVLDDLLSYYKDVYFVTKWEAIQWMRNPTPLKELYRVNLFGCSRDPHRPSPCMHPNICNVGLKSASRFLKTCQPCPKRYPWLNDTGV